MRAVRLTTRRLEAVLPKSMAEVHAEKDLLPAEFAMSTRRLEMTVEQLVNKTISQVVELSKKDDIINQLKVERDAQEIEIIASVGATKAKKGYTRGGSSPWAQIALNPSARLLDNPVARWAACSPGAARHAPARWRTAEHLSRCRQPPWRGLALIIRLRGVALATAVRFSGLFRANSEDLGPYCALPTFLSYR